MNSSSSFEPQSPLSVSVRDDDGSPNRSHQGAECSTPIRRCPEQLTETYDNSNKNDFLIQFLNFKSIFKWKSRLTDLLDARNHTPTNQFSPSKP